MQPAAARGKVSYRQVGERTSVLLNATPLGTVFTGIARYTRSLYETIAKHNLADVDYFYRGQVTHYIPEQGGVVMSRYIPPWLRNGARRARLVGMEGRLRRVLRSNRYGVYHETGLFPHVRDTAVPVVQTIYDLSLITHKNTHPVDRVRHFEHYFFDRLDRIPHVITLSEYIKNEIVDVLGLPPNKVSVVPLAPADHLKRAPEREVGRYLNSKGISDNYILSVATLEPRKNIKNLLEAMICLPQDVTLVCAGWSGWLSKDFDTTIQRLGLGERVLRLGHVTDYDLRLLYSGARALVYPSLYEGFGLPIVEAMSCGCPVVCSNRASMPEVAGDAAILVDPLDCTGLAEEIERICRDDTLRQRLIRKGYLRAKCFSWADTARKTIDVLAHVSRQAG